MSQGKNNTKKKLNENEKKNQLFKYVKTMLKDSKTLNFSYKKLKDKSFKRMLREGKAEKERIYNIENMRNKAIEKILSISKSENNSKSNENKENKEKNSDAN